MIQVLLKWYIWVSYNIDIWIVDLWTSYTVLELLYQYFGLCYGQAFAWCHLCFQRGRNSTTKHVLKYSPFIECSRFPRVRCKPMNYVEGRGGSRGGGRTPLKLEKKKFLRVQSWFFTRNTPKIILCVHPLTWNPGSAPER